MNDATVTITLVIAISNIIITVLIYSLRKKPMNNNVDLAKNKNHEIARDTGDNNNEFNLKKMTDMNKIILNNDTGDRLSLIRTDGKEVEKTIFRKFFLQQQPLGQH